MRKRITVRLSPGSIQSALDEVSSLMSANRNRLDDAARDLAERICEKAQSNFDAAWYDSLARGVRGEANVKCRVEKTGTGYKVVAEGNEVTFGECGAGVYYNPPAGTSPHPGGADLGFVIGGYGKGQGNQKAWGYYAEDGNLVITHGTAAQMPLYRAFEEVLQEAKKR